jgi:putative ABC transport system permease protein
MLRKSPAFTVIALLTLALGIGANTAIFSIVNAVLLKPLPFPDSQRLMFMTSAYESHGTLRSFSTSYADFFDWRDAAKSFTGMASYHQDSFTLTGSDRPLHVAGLTVAGDFFSVLEVQPFLGRVFTRDEEKPGTRVVVLSHDLWESSFHGDRSIVGQTITLDKQSYTVVGVMPAGFAFPLDAEAPKIWRTLAIESESKDPKNDPPATSPAQRGAHYLHVVARLNPGVTIERAHEEMNAIARNLAVQYPDSNKKFASVVLTTELEQMVGDTRPRMVILLIRLVWCC